MKVSSKIKAKDLLSIIYCLSSEACFFHDLAEDETEELTLDMFIEFLEEKSKNQENITLLVSE